MIYKPSGRFLSHAFSKAVIADVRCMFGNGVYNEIINIGVVFLSNEGDFRSVTQEQLMSNQTSLRASHEVDFSALLVFYYGLVNLFGLHKTLKMAERHGKGLWIQPCEPEMQLSAVWGPEILSNMPAPDSFQEIVKAFQAFAKLFSDNTGIQVDVKFEAGLLEVAFRENPFAPPEHEFSVLLGLMEAFLLWLVPHLTPTHQPVQHELIKTNNPLKFAVKLYE